MKLIKLQILLVAVMAITFFISCDNDDDVTIFTVEEGNTVTMRNTYNDSHVPEISFSSYLDFAFAGSEVEFPEALKVQLPDSESPMINGLYAIDLSENSITYKLLPSAEDEFWKTNYRTLEAGVKDRYYLTFSENHNVSDFTASNPAINLRIDANNVLVVEVGEGFVFQPGAAFSISLNAIDEASPAIPQGAAITMRNTYNDSDVPEVSFASYVDFAMGTSLGEAGLDVTANVVYEGVALGEAGLDLTADLSYSSTEFPEALKADLTANGAFLINGLYAINFTENTITYTLLPVAGDPFWSNNYRVLEEGVYDRYYLTFENPHGVSSFTSSNEAVNLRIDSDKILVVEIGEGFDFKPGASFTLSLN